MRLSSKTDYGLRALIDLALGRDVENRSPGELAATTTEIVEAAYRSIEAGQPIALEPQP